MRAPRRLEYVRSGCRKPSEREKTEYLQFRFRPKKRIGNSASPRSRSFLPTGIVTTPARACVATLPLDESVTATPAIDRRAIVTSGTRWVVPAAHLPGVCPWGGHKVQRLTAEPERIRYPLHPRRWGGVIASLPCFPCADMGGKGGSCLRVRSAI